ncbi:hypothetical protein FA13DRAFT_1740633 [Coprinellus micaceus]|uniref:Uncharacterized protein n=1 Tax=Coprinellus micaceus TaxID=71717 RepID=A0A4Y7SLF4_COPMI|nr:hypothetical protein FA13DRAFT_1740633 [Coprinellus micaceus]
MLDAISLHHRRASHLEPASARSTMQGAAPAKSSPIQIPQKRRPIMLSSPYTHTISPEMVFEMSPLSSDFPVCHGSFSVSASSVKGDTKFLYSIPLFPSPKRRENSELAPTRSTSSFRTTNSSPLSRNNSSGSNDVPNVKYPAPRRGHSMLDDNDLSPEPPSHASSTTKVTGFRPIKGELFETQFEDQYRPRLSPGPRRDSYTSSPWILPGKGEGSGEGSAYSQADPNPFEFERQLLRRIENQNRPRFAGLRPFCV